MLNGAVESLFDKGRSQVNTELLPTPLSVLKDFLFSKILEIHVAVLPANLPEISLLF